MDKNNEESNIMASIRISNKSLFMRKSSYKNAGRPQMVGEINQNGAIRES